MTDSELEQAKNNLIASLEALDKGGSEGLEKELDRIYPNTTGILGIEEFMGPGSRARVITRKKIP